MKLIATFNKQANKFMPVIDTIKDTEKTKQQIKKQLLNSIINQPESLKAYKNFEIYQIGEMDGECNITPTEKKQLFTYEEILNEIIEKITEENKKEE